MNIKVSYGNLEFCLLFDKMYLSQILERCDFSDALLKDPRDLPKGDDSIDYEDRFIGALLGIGIGDAFGRPVEGFTPEQIEKIYGSVTEYLEPKHFYHPAEQISIGDYSDDTQMTIDVCKCLIENGYMDPQRLLFFSNSYMIKGAGTAVLKALHYYRHGTPWYECGVDFPWNGGAMRSAPVGMLNYSSAKKLKLEAILSTWPTHVNPQAIAGAIIQAYAIAYMINSKPDFFDNDENVIKFIDDAAYSIEGLESDEVIKSSREKSGKLANKYRIGEYEDPIITIYDRVKKELADMLYKYGNNPKQALKIWGTSVNVFESVPTSLYLFLRSPLDFEQILHTAVNGGGDCDSTASMACGLSGALIGYKNIPKKYVRGLRCADELISLARELYKTSLRIVCK